MVPSRHTARAPGLLVGLHPMSRFLRLAQFSGSHSINLPQLKSFTFGPYLSCPGCLPLFKSPSLLPVPFPSPSSSGSPSCRVTLDRPAPAAGPASPLSLTAASTLVHFSLRDFYLLIGS